MIKEIEFLQRIQELDTIHLEIELKKGALPKEINVLEEDVAQLERKKEATIQQIQEDKQTIEIELKAIKEAEKLIKKYQKEQRENDRQYDNYQKSIVIKKMQIQLAKRKIKEANSVITQNETQIETFENEINEIKTFIEKKQSKLEETEANTQELLKQTLEEKEKIVAKIPPALYQHYQKIYKYKESEPSITSVIQGACNCCHIILPLQCIVEIREKKRIVTCEHCGSILVNVVEEEENKQKRPSRFSRNRKKRSIIIR